MTTSHLDLNPRNMAEDLVAREVKRLAVERETTRLNRRNFIASLGVAAGAVAATGMAGCSSDGSLTVAANQGVVDVLNFALNLEYLEATFYLTVTTGTGLSTTDQGGTATGSAVGSVSGGAKVNFTNSMVGKVATQLALDEQEHVQFLRSTISAIGGTAVSMPALNLAAGGNVTNDATFLAAARQLETVGVSAYAGGAQYLASNATAVLYAAQILDTEAQHEGFLRQLCILLGVASPAVDAQDLPPTQTAIFNTSKTTGLNPVRTFSQVLQIVYASPGMSNVGKGGFFPNGLNGNIKST